MNTRSTDNLQRRGQQAQHDSSNVAGVFRRAQGVSQRFDASVAAEPYPVELSIIVPVFNGSRTIGDVVAEIRAALHGMSFEIILVNDGSADESEEVCSELVERYPTEVSLLQLARNFGEHNAVLAGLKHSCGEYAAILDDDGQNRPQDILLMLEHCRQVGLDVVYGRYRDRQHPYLRVLGSWFNDRIANYALQKPRGLYLSSFKVMTRFIVDDVCRYSGPQPYLDGLILRATKNVGQIDVEHRRRIAGRSGYTVSKLVGLWMNMFMGYSLAPVRALTLVGMLAVMVGTIAAVGIASYKIWIDDQAMVGGFGLGVGLVVAAGIQLFALGIVGEYIARLFLHQSDMPQYVLRYAQSARMGASNQFSPRPGSMRITSG